jgi:hypothetical protein
VGQDAATNASDLPCVTSGIFLIWGLDISSENQNWFARRVDLSRLTDLICWTCASHFSPDFPHQAFTVKGRRRMWTFRREWSGPKNFRLPLKPKTVLLIFLSPSRWWRPGA